MWGGVVPSPPGEGAGEGLCPSSENFLILALNMVSFGAFGIFYSSATCFTRKTGVIWCPSPYFFFNFSLQKGPGSFSCILA